MVSRLAKGSAICFAVVVSSLAGCADYIGFYERSDTDLSVALSATPTSPEPVGVNVGYNRHIYAVVPKKCSKWTGEDNCETKSLVSNFTVSLGQKPDGTSSFETHLRNGFATGDAASELAAHPVVAKELLGLSMVLNTQDEIKYNVAVIACIKSVVAKSDSVTSKSLIAALEANDTVKTEMAAGIGDRGKLEDAKTALNTNAPAIHLTQGYVDGVISAGGAACATGA